MAVMRQLLVLFAGALAAISAPAHAQFTPGASWSDGGQSARRAVSQSEARDAVHQGRAMPSHEIRERLAARYGGDMSDADMYVENGRYFYNIEWRTRKGERLRLTVDARSARVISEGR